MVEYGNFKWKEHLYNYSETLTLQLRILQEVNKYSIPPVLKVMYHEIPVGGAEALGGDPPTKIIFHNF